MTKEEIIACGACPYHNKIEPSCVYINTELCRIRRDARGEKTTQLEAETDALLEKVSRLTQTLKDAEAYADDLQKAFDAFDKKAR